MSELAQRASLGEQVPEGEVSAQPTLTLHEGGEPVRPIEEPALVEVKDGARTAVGRTLNEAWDNWYSF
jgi:hypothetical protein